MANILKIFKNNNKLRADQVYYDSTTSLLEAMWPIGRGFIDFTGTDYSNYLGFTWERELVGLTPVGYKAGDSDFGTIGKTLGSKTHTLSVQELASHTHNGSKIFWNGNSNHTHGAHAGIVAEATQDGQDGGGKIIIENTGDNQPFSIIQPSKVVAYWKRIS